MLAKWERTKFRLPTKYDKKVEKPRYLKSLHAKFATYLTNMNTQITK